MRSGPGLGLRRSMLAGAFALLPAIVPAALPGGAAGAQFKLYESPSSQRAAGASAAANAAQAAKDLARRPGMRPLSPLGGSQGTPLQAQPAAPVGSSPYAAATPVGGAPANGLSGGGYGAANSAANPVIVPPAGVAPATPAAPLDPSIDDPNKPRQALRPKSLTQGVAPR